MFGPHLEGPSRQQLTPDSGITETGKDNKDVVDLLDDDEALEFMEFNPTVEASTTWTPSETTVNFLEKNFNRCLPDRDPQRLP